MGSVCNSGILLEGTRIACSPHKPYMCYDRQISAPPSPEGKPRRMSGELWKMNPTITSDGGKKHTGTSGKVFPLVHIILRFVFVEKRDENEVFHNYRFILAEIENMWVRRDVFFHKHS